MAYKARERTVGCTKQRIAQAGTGLEVNGQVQEVVPGAEKKTKDGCVDAAVRNQDIHSMGIVMGPRCGFYGGGCVMIWYSGIRVFTQLQTNQPISRVKKGEKVTNSSGRFQYFHWTHTHFSWLNPYLVGGFSPYPSEKWWNEFVSWDYSLNMMGKSFKIPWFQSPPTRYFLGFWISPDVKSFPFCHRCDLSDCDLSGALSLKAFSVQHGHPRHRETRPGNDCYSSRTGSHGPVEIGDLPS
jgi:hypothetical protein